MRPSRRALLGLSCLGAAGLSGAAVWHWHRRRGTEGRRAVEVRAAPLPSLDTRSPDRRRFGELAFRSGLVLSSDDAGFGGLSGLWRSPAGGRELVAVTDHGQWLTATVQTSGGTLAALSRAEMAPILGQEGEPLGRGPAYDTESLAIADGTAFVGIERLHEVRRFDWARSGVGARGVPLPLPPETRDLPANGGIEAVAVAPAGHPLAGALVAIAEEARRGDDAPTLGWIVAGPDRFGFEVARSEDFDVTDAAFLPSGELLLLERRYAPLTGVACRMRRVRRDAIQPGALLDGPVILALDDAHEIDNMEALSVHRDAESGTTLLTLLSDNNFSPLQRTVMLEFSLLG